MGFLTFKVNSFGRRYASGKPLDNDVRQLIVLNLLEAGANEFNGHIPRGAQQATAIKYKVDHKVVGAVWKRYIDEGSLSPTESRSCGKQPRKLGQPAIDFLEHLKLRRPSITYKEMFENLQNVVVLPNDVSTSSIGRVVRDELQMTFKKLTKAKAEKFTLENIQYCQHFLNYMSTVKAENIKFYDECGFNLNDCNPSYGHSEKGTRAVEIIEGGRAANLMLLCSIEEIDFAKVIVGPADTVEYLQFWAEADQFLTSLRMFSPGDHIVVDNCPTYKYEGAEALAEFLAQTGSWLIFLPAYSPEFNVAELVFGCLKEMCKRRGLRLLAKTNYPAATYGLLSTLTPARMYQLFSSCSYFHR